MSAVGLLRSWRDTDWSSLTSWGWAVMIIWTLRGDSLWVVSANLNEVVVADRNRKRRHSAGTEVAATLACHMDFRTNPSVRISLS